MKEFVEKIAKIAAGIHSHSLHPFYIKDGETNTDFWETLEEKAESDEDVDKEFFREIAMSIYEIANKQRRFMYYSSLRLLIKKRIFLY